MLKRRHLLCLVPGLSLGLYLGCVHHPVQTVLPPEPAPYQQFVSQKFDWSTVKRVVLLPLANQTDFEHASVELQTNLAAELQRMGRFDIVVATVEDPAARARDVFANGGFDEIELLRIARQYDAQAILFGNVTNYHPYAPPRVGLSLVMICPAEGVAIASTDGLWDARELTTARQAHEYLQQKLSWRQGLLGVDRVLESPDVYQRFVCHQIASSLNPPDMNVAAPPLSNVPTEILPAGYESPAGAPLRKFKPHIR
jgi:hypothetical protein